MASKSTLSARRSKVSNGKPEKPYPDFPLFPHATGRWAKRIRGKFHYFGNRKNLSEYGWQAALDFYVKQRDDLQAGRKPRDHRDALTTRDLCNHFLTFNQARVASGELKLRSFTDYHATCERIIGVLGTNRIVEDLGGDDFETLRSEKRK